MDLNDTTLLATHPAVFAVGEEYQVMLPLKREALVSVKCGDEEYFDDTNGIIRSKCTVHRVRLPMAVLDAAKEYTVCCRPVIERKPYFPETAPLQEYVYVFRPLEKRTDIHITHISDTHGLVDPPVRFARQFETDLLVMNGDIASFNDTEDDMLVLYRIVSAVAGGEIPCVFARGNHDLRGELAEQLERFTPHYNGHSFYTFRVGCVWGVVLDCGEDKLDEHAEYGHTICCHIFRQRVTHFLQEVIARADEEYAAAGVQYRLVLAHNPFTYENIGEFCIEQEVFRHWVELLRDYVKPHLMLCGHQHINDVWMPQSVWDSYGQTWPVVVASKPEKEEKRFLGASLTLRGDVATVIYADSENRRSPYVILKI